MTNKVERLSREELIKKLAHMTVNEQRYHTLLDDCSDAIFSFNREGQYLYVNRQFALGINGNIPEDIIGKTVWEILPKDEAEKRFAVVQWVFDNRTARNVEICLPGEEINRYYLTTVKPILDDQEEVEYVICISKEITSRKIIEEKLKRNALYDYLTGLANRLLFADRLRFSIIQAKRKAGKIALMFIDLDNFKPVNDTHGHEAGDLLLKYAAKRIKNCTRESDTVGRIGGDEFVVLLPSNDKAQEALKVAEKIRNEINKPFELSGFPPIHISSSIGVALYPEHGSNATRLTKSADVAMYLAKEKGRNCVVLYE